MKSSIARKYLMERLRIGTEQARGRSPRVIRTTSTSRLDQSVPDVSKLPCVTTDPPPMQNAAGLFYFIVGYSAVGGPDVAAPGS